MIKKHIKNKILQMLFYCFLSFVVLLHFLFYFFVNFIAPQTEGYGFSFCTPVMRGVSILEMAFPRPPGEPELLLLLL